jgi:hypothetical protein
MYYAASPQEPWMIILFSLLPIVFSDLEENRHIVRRCSTWLGMSNVEMAVFQELVCEFFGLKSLKSVLVLPECLGLLLCDH